VGLALVISLQGLTPVGLYVCFSPVISNVQTQKIHPGAYLKRQTFLYCPGSRRGGCIYGGLSLTRTWVQKVRKGGVSPRWVSSLFHAYDALAQSENSAARAYSTTATTDG